MANIVLQIVHLIAGTVRGLLQHDSTTSGASVQFWAVAATVLLLLKFAVGSIGPRFSSRRLMAPSVRLLEILNYYAVNYTLGLMKPSSSSSDPGAATRVNAFFQIWAVLITTMQDSIRIGRPYKPKEMSLIDLLSSLWSANELRGPAPMYLKVPLWIMWSIHAARIIWYYFTFNRARDAGLSNIKLVSDYMMTSQHTDGNACPQTMRGYKYIVFGEDIQKMEVRPPGFTLEMDLDGPNADQLVTTEDIWRQAGVNSDDKLLKSDADTDSQFKDACLSFALYKLQRRRFYNFPVAEATHTATRWLVSGNILKGAKELAESMQQDASQEVTTNNIPVEGDDHVEATDPATRHQHTSPENTRRQPDSLNMKLDDAAVERAFRITEVELSFLQDLFYSKHAAVFARGFPYVRLALSLLMTAAALYLVYAARHIPSFSTAVTTRGGHVARITHGVFVTHCITAVVICRELWEVGVYVVSQWSKVWIIGRHMMLTNRLKPVVGAENLDLGPENWYQKTKKWFQGMSWRCQLVMLHMVARIMFFIVRRGRWDRRIRQYNILMSALIRNKDSNGPLRRRIMSALIIRKVKLPREVAVAVFQSLIENLIKKIDESPGPGSEPSEAWTKQTNKLLKSYFDNAFGNAPEPSPTDNASSRSSSTNTSSGSPSTNGSSSPTPTRIDDLSRDAHGSSSADPSGPSSTDASGSTSSTPPHIVNPRSSSTDASGSSSSTLPRITNPAGKLKGETHKILVWHIATSLCQIKLLEGEAGHRGHNLYTLPRPFGPGLAAHYITAVSLSNYCAYLVTEALVPDNGLVVSKVFHAVRDEVRDALKRCTKMTEIHGKLESDEMPPSEETTILKMGTRLSSDLLSTYKNDEELWKRLAKFWAGFLLHLSASTRAAKHQIHLQGRGELTTHLWVLLSHAGFLGEIRHAEQLADPVDKMYV